jgi:hypothetical protein
MNGIRRPGRPAPSRVGPAALAALVMLACVVGACGASSVLRPPESVLVSVELTGGECPQGPCGMRYELRRSGQVTATGQPPRSVDAGTVARIAAAVDGASWDAILARPFTGECPTSYDGQELTYTFDTVRGAIVVASCSVQIDPGQEPFRSVNDALFASGG